MFRKCREIPFVEHEARLNYVLPRFDDPVICNDANLLDATLAIDIHRTHPVVVIGNEFIISRQHRRCHRTG